MQTTLRTDIHASDIVEETQNRLHTAKHAFINNATRENDSTDMRMECRKQKRQASKKNTQCYVLKQATHCLYISCSVT